MRHQTPLTHKTNTTKSSNNYSPITDELAAQTAAHMVTVHPDYGLLAARIEVSNLPKNTKKVFSEVICGLYNYINPRSGEAGPLISGEVYNLVMKNKESLDSAIVYGRDYGYDYFGIKTLTKSYLLKLNGRIAERPQHMLMRVGLGIHLTDLDSAIETYYLTGDQHCTPTPPIIHNHKKHNHKSKTVKVIKDDRPEKEEKESGKTKEHTNASSAECPKNGDDDDKEDEDEKYNADSGDENRDSYVAKGDEKDEIKEGRPEKQYLESGQYKEHGSASSNEGRSSIFGGYNDCEDDCFKDVEKIIDDYYDDVVKVLNLKSGAIIFVDTAYMQVVAAKNYKLTLKITEDDITYSKTVTYFIGLNENDKPEQWEEIFDSDEKYNAESGDENR